MILKRKGCVDLFLLILILASSFSASRVYASNNYVCLDTNKIYDGLASCRNDCDWSKCKGYVGNVQPGETDPRVGAQPYGPATGKWQCPANATSNSQVFYGTAGECSTHCSTSCQNKDGSSAPPPATPTPPPASTPAPTPATTQSNTKNTITPTLATQTPGRNTTSQTQTPGVNTGTGSNITLKNPLPSGISNLPDFLAKLLDFVVRIGTVVIVLMLIYVGYLFVVAQGKPGELENAKKALLYTIIGALILLGARVIAEGIAATVQALSVGK